jgi:hypothetical protein
VFTDPRLVESEVIHGLEYFEVALKPERRTLFQPVERWHENTVPHRHPQLVDIKPLASSGVNLRQTVNTQSRLSDAILQIVATGSVQWSTRDGAVIPDR